MANTVVIDFNDITAVRQKLDDDGDIAAMILDPAMFAGGLWPAKEKYLRSLRQLTTERDIVSIFDEVITGFRIAPGGAQEYYGVTPDLATFAKALAAGGSLSAVAGRADIMNVVLRSDASDAFALQARGVFQSGTTNDDTASLAAAIGALRAYEKLGDSGGYKRIHGLAEKLRHGLIDRFHRIGIPCHANRWGALLRIVLSDVSPSFCAHQPVDKTVLSLFLRALINQGVLLSIPTSGPIYLSFAHTEADIDIILEKTETVLDKYRFADLF